MVLRALGVKVCRADLLYGVAKAQSALQEHVGPRAGGLEQAHLSCTFERQVTTWRSKVVFWSRQKLLQVALQGNLQGGAPAQIAVGMSGP